MQRTHCVRGTVRERPKGRREQLQEAMRMPRLVGWRQLKAVLAAVFCASAVGMSWCQEASPEEGAVGAPQLPTEEQRPRERPVMGRVTDLNPLKGYIQLESFPEGVSRVVVVTAETKMTRPGAITVAELQVGDAVRVSGIPVQLEAASISVEAPREAADSGGEAATESAQGTGDAEEPMASSAAPANESPEGTAAEARPSRASGSVSVSGVVKSLDPLTIAIFDGLAVTVTLTEQTVITKPMPGTIEDVSVGNFVWASGARNADDLLQAAELRIVPADEAMARMTRFPSPFAGGLERREPFGGLRGSPGRGGGFGTRGDRSFRGRGPDSFGERSDRGGESR